MRRLSFLKMLVPPATVPLALWMFVALAGPGGVVNVGDDAGPASGSAESTTFESDDVAGVDGDTDTDVAGATDAEGDADGGDAFADSHSNGNGCEWALTEQAQARSVLEEHVADAGMPPGGADGNQNALDHQCGGAFGADSVDASSGEPETGPGKSEDARGDPEPKGQAQGQGQTNADAKRNGAADAPGQNKPPNDREPSSGRGKN